MNGSLDVSEFEDARRGPGVLCWWTALPLSDEQRAKLTEVFEHRPDITAAAVSRVMSTWGFKLKGQTVLRHRKGDCECGKNR